jgi:hypothetical protein
VKTCEHCGYWTGEKPPYPTNYPVRRCESPRTPELDGAPLLWPWAFGDESCELHTPARDGGNETATTAVTGTDDSADGEPV